VGAKFVGYRRCRSLLAKCVFQKHIFDPQMRKLENRSDEEISGRDGAEILGSAMPSLGTGNALFSEHRMGNCRWREMMFI